MSHKLIKVAKEFNVGLHTIVDTLNAKGFALDERPNAEVTEEMYDVLRREFQKDLAIKQEADKLLRPTLKKDAPPPAPAPPTPLPTPAPAQRPSLLSPREEPKPAPPPPSPPPAAPPPPKEEPEPIQRERPSLRILGRIDLQPKPAPPPPPVEAPAPPAPSKPEVPPVAEQEKPAPPVSAPEVPSATPQEQKPATEKPVAEKLATEKPAAEKPAVGKPAPPPAPQESKPVVAKPVPSPSAATPAPSDTSSADDAATGDSELYRAEAAPLRGLKILGKINLEVRKPEPENKGRDRDRKRGGRDRGGNQQNQGGQNQGGQNQGGQNQGGQNQGGQNHGGNRGPNQGGPNQGGNRGPNQGGQNPGGQQQAQGTGGQGQNNGDRRKRKRKTVQQPITAESLQASMSGGNQGERRSGGGGGGGGQGTAGGQANKNRGPEAPKEVSQKDIENQIRQTMARLGGGASRKRQKIRRDKRGLMRDRAVKADVARSEQEKTLQVTEFISVSDLASLINVKPAEVIKTCMSLGVFVSINQRLDAELIEVVANEFGYEVEFISAEEQVEVEEVEIDDPTNLTPRQPIVTVMGHVDHGKTSLLDFIRRANVASGEAGGITQHIGAYEVITEEGRRITFLDTPGHEAFTAMRARGAKVTDIAIIVVAADDNIMPQTREAISHAQAAGVPIVFAINKIDKAGADPERIKNELAQMNMMVEEWGGKYQSQDISAKKGTNVDKLLEKVLLEAELLDLKANPGRRAVGTLLEASLDKGRGYVAKLLVENGTLRDGDPIIAGEFAGKVKAMFNEHGKKVKEAGPATPVLVLGLPGAPQAGEKIKVTVTEAEAKEIASKRAQIIREQATRASKRISLEEIGRRLALGNFKELKIIVKGDVDGSVEALSDSLIKLSVEKVQVSVIHKAVGQIVDSDVMLASASDAIIIGFQVRPSLTARKLAEKEGVEIKLYSIIYEAIEEIKAAMEGMLEPVKEEEIVGQVEIREVYKISKIGTVAGCYVLEGKISRNNNVRIIRDGIVVYPANPSQHAELASLKRFKDDVKDVKSNMECGLTIKNFNDIKAGDIVEAYVVNEVKAKL